MPRKNNRPHPPEQRTHQLDSFTMWAERVISENSTERQAPHVFLTSEKGKKSEK